MSDKVTSAIIPAKTNQRLKELIQSRAVIEQQTKATENTINQIILALLETNGFESERFDDYIIDIEKGKISLKEVKREVEPEDVEIVK